MQCWKRTPSMERCQTTSAPTRQDRSRIDRAPERVETEIDWTPPPGDHPRSRSWDIHTRVRLYITELIHKHTHTYIQTIPNKHKQNTKPGGWAGFRTLKALQLQCAQSHARVRVTNPAAPTTPTSSRIIAATTTRHPTRRVAVRILRAVNDNTKIANNFTLLDPHTTGVT